MHREMPRVRGVKPQLADGSSLLGLALLQLGVNDGSDFAAHQVRSFCLDHTLSAEQGTCPGRRAGIKRLPQLASGSSRPGPALLHAGVNEGMDFSAHDVHKSWLDLVVAQAGRLAQIGLLASSTCRSCAAGPDIRPDPADTGRERQGEP